MFSLFLFILDYKNAIHSEKDIVVYVIGELWDEQ